MKKIQSFDHSSGAVGAIYSKFGNGQPLFEPAWHDYKKTINVDTYTCISVLPHPEGALYADKKALKVSSKGVFALMNGRIYTSEQAIIQEMADICRRHGLVLTQSRNDGARHRVA